MRSGWWANLGGNARAKQLLQEVLELPPEERAHSRRSSSRSSTPRPTRGRTPIGAKEIERRSGQALDPAWHGRTWEEVRAEVELTLRRPRGG
jgi:hypothetical protein